MKELNLFTWQMKLIDKQVENLKRQGYEVDNCITFRKKRDEEDNEIRCYALLVTIGDEKREIEFLY